MKPRGTLHKNSKRTVSSNNLKNYIKKKSRIGKKINYINVKEAFDKKLIKDLNNQTFFKDKDGTYPTLIAVAIRNEDDKLVDFIINQGIDPNTVCSDGETLFSKLLWYIPSYYDFNLVKKFINEGLDINKRGTGSVWNRYEPLTIALHRGMLVMAEFLIKNGANLEPVCADPELCTGCIPLQCAINKESNHIVHLLLERGVDVNKYCYQGKPPLFKAIHYRNNELVKCLLERGAYIGMEYSDYHPSVYCRTALDEALVKKNSEALQLLLNHELIDVNITPRRMCYSILHNAVRFTSLSCMDILLNANPNINFVSKTLYGYKLAVEMIKECTKENLEVLEKLKTHIVKLRAAGYYLRDENLLAVAGKEYESFYTECCQEVEAMKITTISPKSHVNFYDVLFMTHQKLALCLESLQDQEILHSGFQDKFPSYAGMIEFKLKKSYQWIKLQEELYIAVYSLFGKYLPSTIMEQIFSYFSAADLMELRRYRFKYEKIEKKLK